MIIAFSKKAWDQYLHWQQHDRQTGKRLNQLLEEMRRSPYSGTGKPEPLRYELAGYWSRRITDEHRITYRVIDDTIFIEACRYHY
jgi:toxin YoeB